MKKLLKFLPLLLVALLATTFASCSNDDKDDDDDSLVSEATLPANAKSFINQYFSDTEVKSVWKDTDDYTVVMKNGQTIEFSLAGNWTDVKAPAGESVPTGFYPNQIDTYVSANYNGALIKEISTETYGYEVDLSTGIDLRFDQDGNFLSIDH